MTESQHIYTAHIYLHTTLVHCGGYFKLNIICVVVNLQYINTLFFSIIINLNVSFGILLVTNHNILYTNKRNPKYYIGNGRNRKLNNAGLEQMSKLSLKGMKLLRATELSQDEMLIKIRSDTHKHTFNDARTQQHSVLLLIKIWERYLLL